MSKYIDYPNTKVIRIVIKISRPYIGTVDSKYGVQVGEFDKLFLTVILMVENMFDGYGDGYGEYFLFGGDGYGDGEIFLVRR